MSFNFILWYFISDVIFGFERTELAVGEAVGGVDVCVVAFNPAPSDALEATINFNIRAQPGTAGESELNIGVQ